MTVTTDRNPFEMFSDWMAEAEKTEPSDANAMTLATASPDGVPSARMVLLKGLDEQGFTFYTNLGSDKARELDDNPVAALCFHWKSLRRQVRVQGAIEVVNDGEADEYFASRAKDSQIGAWASQQSRPLPDRFALEKAVAVYAAKYALSTVPRPAYWSGFRLIPQRFEFWQDKPFRLHDREVYLPDGDSWRTEKLFP